VQLLRLTLRFPATTEHQEIQQIQRITDKNYPLLEPIRGQATVLRFA
jgi:hypothetical protein